ncbi:ImmA/IrrE family metallo-endopeptidase [Listeria fleischmannii]|uniref:ImmA/IrrE family metallo-endopeptidase n=1 Tax=Listeria fleischmannii TaxID=1069827 RepID=UPI0035E19B8F
MHNQPYICINKNIGICEQWFDFAHELGHVIKHCRNQHRLPAIFVDFQEKQANNFAEHFLVPTFILEKMNFPPPVQSEQNIFYMMKLFPVNRTVAKSACFSIQPPYSRHVLIVTTFINENNAQKPLHL